MIVSPTIEIDGKHVTLEQIEEIAVRGARIEVAAAARERVAAARDSVERQYSLGAIIYGVTTGFGRMANVVIDRTPTRRRCSAISFAATPPGPVRRFRSSRACGRPACCGSLAVGRALGHPPRDAAICWSSILNRGVTPVVPCSGLGRRQRRPRAARAHDADADR